MVMQTLQAFFAENNSSDIFTIGRYVQQYINENWQVVFQAERDEMVRLYPEIGDSVYGVYGNKLFKALHEEFKANGLRATPKLPGSLNISREWGEDERDRQRWMWSKIVGQDGKAVGTIVTIFYHDHVEIRIPRVFKVIALKETSKGAVIEALSQMSADFAYAMDMKEEIELYMQQFSAES
jgi:hypothetical protein